MIVCYSVLDSEQAIRAVLLRQVAKGKRSKRCEALQVFQCQFTSLAFARNAFEISFQLSSTINYQDRCAGSKAVGQIFRRRGVTNTKRQLVTIVENR